MDREKGFCAVKAPSRPIMFEAAGDHCLNARAGQRQTARSNYLQAIQAHAVYRYYRCSKGNM